VHCPVRAFRKIRCGSKGVHCPVRAPCMASYLKKKSEMDREILEFVLTTLKFN
jgi:hypothetical protein